MEIMRPMNVKKTNVVDDENYAFRIRIDFGPKLNKNGLNRQEAIAFLKENLKRNATNPKAIMLNYIAENMDEYAKLLDGKEKNNYLNEPVNTLSVVCYGCGSCYDSTANRDGAVCYYDDGTNQWSDCAIC